MFGRTENTADELLVRSPSTTLGRWLDSNQDMPAERKLSERTSITHDKSQLGPLAGYPCTANKTHVVIVVLRLTSAFRATPGLPIPP